jgi:2-amino-4-hydroxy-6-hydroxymethyldihydropteridine diphosphokinase
VKRPSRSKKKSATTTRTSRTRGRSSRATAWSRKKTSDSRERTTLAYLGLGSNLGDRRAYLESALSEIARLAPIKKVSSFYRTEPVGFRDQPDFWNAVVEVEWTGSARRLLAAAREVERRVGRTPSFANGPREIDVDVLDFGGRVRDTRDPVLPHPRLNGRRFALAPLAEINPDWTDPRTGRSVVELLAALPKSPRARRVGKQKTKNGKG